MCLDGPSLWLSSCLVCCKNTSRPSWYADGVASLYAKRWKSHLKQFTKLVQQPTCAGMSMMRGYEPVPEALTIARGDPSVCAMVGMMLRLGPLPMVGMMLRLDPLLGIAGFSRGQ